MSWVAAATGIADKGISLIDDLWMSEEEERELDLKEDRIDLGHDELATKRKLSEDRVRIGMFEGAQASSRTQTLALAGLVGVSVVTGGLILAFGGGS